MPVRRIILMTILLVLAACGQREAAPADAAAPAAAPAMPASARAATPMRAERMAQPKAQPKADNDVSAATPAQQLSSSSLTYHDGERQFIRTGNVNFMVKDAYQSALAIEDTAASFGGFVTHNDIAAQVQQTQRHPGRDGNLIELAEYTVHGQIEVRVPSAKTQEFLRAIVGQIVFLDQRSFAARDAQFDLLRQRLEAQRNQETQQALQQATAGGGKLEQKADVIEARNQTKADRDNALVARQELEDQIAYSTITLSMYQPPTIRETEIKDIDGEFNRHRPSFGYRLGDALHAGWDHLLDTTVWLAAAWPLWLGLLIVAVVFGKVTKHRTKATPHTEE